MKSFLRNPSFGTTHSSSHTGHDNVFSEFMFLPLIDCRRHWRQKLCKQVKLLGSTHVLLQCEHTFISWTPAIFFNQAKWIVFRKQCLQFNNVCSLTIHVYLTLHLF